jgi:DNA ligase (NAD+)
MFQSYCSINRVEIIQSDEKGDEIFMTLLEIQQLIDRADVAYYTTGNSIMEDAKYDQLKLELKFLNPDDIRLKLVGSSVRDTILKKTKHSIPMGSLSKSTSEQEFNDWLKNNIFKTGIKSDELFHASYKMDGGSFSLTYKNGRLSEAISRGDGLIGEDITANAFKFKGLVKQISNKFSGFVRGEVVLTTEDWNVVDPEQLSNPRNLATGISRRKDGLQSEYLTFYAFRAFDENGNPLGRTEAEMMECLDKLGFLTVKSFVGYSDDVWKWYLAIQQSRNSLNYWIDGIVVKLNNIEKQLKLGESSNCPNGMVAIKFEAENVTTTLLEVSLQVGNSGVICPVATFEPVRIGGTTITNASLCNWNNIEMLDVCIGDKVSVCKSGDIIPRIMEVVEKGINRKLILLPVNCPVCNTKLERKENITGAESTAIYCVNQQCSAIITGKIEKFVKSTDIQEIGTSLIEALVKDMGVKTPADLYLLHNREEELANLILSGKVRFGEKRTEKFLEEIEKKRTLSLSDFLGSLLIFGLGKRRVKLIQEAANGNLDTLENWFDDYLVKNASQCGVVNIAKRIHDDIVNQKDYILSFIKNGLVIETIQPKSKSGGLLYCITGKLSQPKEHFHNLIEKAGHSWTDTYTKSVTYLVAADKNSGSSKLKKAEKNGTTVIDENELVKMISV